MNHPIYASLLWSLALVTAQPRAQDQASTLDALSNRATCITQVRILAVARDDRGESRVTMQSLKTFKGTDPGQFVLHEPGARACGRALYGLLPGRSYLVFLDQSASEPRLTISSARSLAALEPELLTHLRQLLASPDGVVRISILTTGLSSGSPRVREDSALALPLQVDLPRADEDARTRITAALQDSLAQNDRRLFSLMQSATLLGIDDALPLMLESYLQGSNPGFRRALCSLLPRFPSDDLAAALSRTYERKQDSAGLMLTLLEQMPTQSARPLLLKMADSEHRLLALGAGTSLLRSGFGQAELSTLLGTEFAQACAQRAAPERPKFRTVLLGAGADEKLRD